MARSHLWSWRVIRLHITLIVLGTAFGFLARWQIDRALSGNELSWAYAVEWPLFTVYAVFLWRRLLLDELHSDGTAPSKHRLPVPSLIANHTARKRAKLDRRNAAEDVRRERYNSYLADLAARDNDSTTQ